LPLALEASRLGAAARAVRALQPVADAEGARQSMFALERLGRAHAAPEGLVRAAHGVCACALSLAMAQNRGEEAAEKAARQLVSALVRLATASVRAGVPEADMARAFATSS